jgi:UDP-N-acetylglucosamine 2-epimerase (non-hydrolysing)
MGTRPEVIKLAPVYRAICAEGKLKPIVLLTGQHKQHVDEALSAFDMSVTLELGVMVRRQKLGDLGPRLLRSVVLALRRLQPDYVLVQGDTLSTFAVGWASFLEGVPVGHVEAGLRSGTIDHPFPEEANRRLTSVVTDLDFAPTPDAAENLLREGKPKDRVLITGQTGVDAIRQLSKDHELPAEVGRGPFVTVTFHRRENWALLEDLIGAVKRMALLHPELRFVFPVHWNPAVREKVFPGSKGVPNLSLIDPLPYPVMAALLRQSVLIVTDSGGLQEEGVALGVPVVVAREVTERPEGIATGGLVVAGRDLNKIVRAGRAFLSADRFTSTRETRNVYGDGKAGLRVARGVAWRLGIGRRPADWSPPSIEGRRKRSRRTGSTSGSAGHPRVART